MLFYAVAVFAPAAGRRSSPGCSAALIGDRASQAVTILCMIVAAVCGITELRPVHR